MRCERMTADGPVSRLDGLRVCMLTSGHPPGDDRIFFKEARTLVRAGAEVTVVHRAGKATPSPADGVSFRGFEGPRSLKGRAMNVARLAREASATRPDVIHCHEPDALVSALVAADGRVPVIYDSHEMWGASAAGRFPSPLWPLVERAFQAGERRLIRRCSAAIGASWAISDFLRQELDGSRVETILNVPVPEVFGPPPARGWGEVTYLCHDGHLSWDRGLKVMVEAARIVARDHRVVLKIVGDVFREEREWLDGYLEQHRCAGLVERTGWLPYSEVGNALASCHIGLVALQRIPNNVVTSSNKVFNYMLYGIPFVGPEFRLSKQKLAREERCGVLADSSSPESYARAISAMIEDRAGTEEMGRRAAAASRERYRWEHMEPLLVGLYRRVLGA